MPNLPPFLIRKFAELPYLTQRLICHVDCNHLTPTGKRSLFASTREDVRRGIVYERIHEELIKALRSDDDLIRLKNEAREEGMREQDETATQQMRREVARLLRIHGVGAQHATACGESQFTTPNVPDAETTSPLLPALLHPPQVKLSEPGVDRPDASRKLLPAGILSRVNPAGTVMVGTKTR